MGQPDWLDDGDGAAGRRGLLPGEPPVRLHGATVFAAGFAAGIAVGWQQPWPLVWPWIAAALSALVTAAIFRRTGRRGSTILVGIACLGLGAAWVTVRQTRVAVDDLAGMIGDEPALIRVRGTALTKPETRILNAGSLGVFDYRPPVSFFQMTVDGIESRAGEFTPVRGRVVVRVDEVIPPFVPGDRLTVTGFIHRPSPPHNPGEFDYPRHARTLGQAGLLTVTSAALVVVEPRIDSGWWFEFQCRHDDLKERASGWVLSGLPDELDPRTPALLANLLLGQREPSLEGIEQAFARIGLAHLLAISGAHLAVLVGVVLLVLRWRGRERRWHAWLVIALVLGYLLLIEVRVPVVRAAVMTIFACIGLLTGRRLRIAGLLELSAILVLLWRPDQLFDAGFQLSYGVVLGLIYLAPVVRERWFGPPTMLASTTRQMIGQGLRSAAAAAVMAWAVATPLQVFHFGTISPLGVPLTLLMLPLVSLMLAVGYLKMVLAVALPSASMLIGLPLARMADGLVWLVAWCDRLPGSALHVPFASGLWSALALGWVGGWALLRSRRSRRRLHVAFVALVVWLLWPLMPLGTAAALRIDMLSVNNGTCIILRSGGETMVFDAGSSPDLDIGRRSIVPAVRRLGVRSIDVLAISHANIDHYASVIELAEAVPVREVLLTPQMIRATEGDSNGPVAMLMRELTSRGVPCDLIAAGAVRRLGAARMEWLHPQADDEYDKVNDASMVIRVAVGDRRVLLTGDIQREAMVVLLAGSIDLRADVIEHPHHGSHHDLAVAFLEAAQPSIVMQSTGPRRLEPDRWAAELAGTQRLITARDGACWVEIERDGTITTGRFLPGGQKDAP